MTRSDDGGSLLPYAGDLSPREAWELLEGERGAALVDVRTDAEWAYVGGPDLGNSPNVHCRVSWKVFPGMHVNEDFVEAVADAVPDRSAPILFLCRSGVRSRDAAMAMTAAGWSRCFNIAEGFEGDRDARGHRGTVNGWKIAGLPWTQG